MTISYAAVGHQTRIAAIDERPASGHYGGIRLLNGITTVSYVEIKPVKTQTYGQHHLMRCLNNSQSIHFVNCFVLYTKATLKASIQW